MKTPAILAVFLGLTMNLMAQSFTMYMGSVLADSHFGYFHRRDVNPQGLTPNSELENAVKAKVRSGLYNNASEVIRDALRQSLVSETENTWLAREAAIDYAQLESGETVPVESKEQFIAKLLAAKIRRQ